MALVDCLVYHFFSVSFLKEEIRMNGKIIALHRCYYTYYKIEKKLCNDKSLKNLWDIQIKA